MCNNKESINREYVEWKKPGAKVYTLDDSTYMKIKKKQN